MRRSNCAACRPTTGAQVLFDVPRGRQRRGRCADRAQRRGQNITVVRGDGLDASHVGQRRPKWRRHQPRAGIRACAPRSGLRAGRSAHFTDLTVAENLRIALHSANDGFTEQDLLMLFPNLTQMLHRPASAMSGGEQQMLAVARTLAANPRVVLLDEPSGARSARCGEDARRHCRDEGARRRDPGVEQNLRFAAAIADRAVLIEQGRIVGAAKREELLAPSADVQRVLTLNAAVCY